MNDENDSGKRLKCPACYAVAYPSEVTNYGGKDGKAPMCNDCGLEMYPLCPNDHKCECLSSVHSGVKYCPVCGEATCPDCGAHDVTQISRVTGYLQDVSGWNRAKQQELKDRHRVQIVDGIST
jgi:hypothetical protein